MGIFHWPNNHYIMEECDYMMIPTKTFLSCCELNIRYTLHKKIKRTVQRQINESNESKKKIQPETYVSGFFLVFFFFLLRKLLTIESQSLIYRAIIQGVLAAGQPLYVM